MGNWIELAARVLIGSASAAGSGRAATVRMTVAVLCAGLGAVLMLAALGCTATALWIFMLPSLGPVGALLVVAAALSSLALALATAVRLIMRHGRRRPGVATAPHLLATEATRFFGEHKGALLLAAVVAGMAAANGGRRP